MIRAKGTLLVDSNFSLQEMIVSTLRKHFLFQMKSMQHMMVLIIMMLAGSI